MYLTDCHIENVGPIELLDLKLPFDTNGNPKPIILVGANGSGKTILLSHIVDALFEMWKTAYPADAPGYVQLHTQYFKVISASNQRMGKSFGLALLRFLHESTAICYADKSGIVNAATLPDPVRQTYSSVMWSEGQESLKSVLPQTIDMFRAAFKTNSISFFPSSRHELPHWLNTKAIEDKPVFDIGNPDANRLGKPIVVESAAPANWRWLMDVLLDARIDFTLEPVFQTDSVSPPPVNIVPANDAGTINDKLLLMATLKNVDQLLAAILRVGDARLGALYRMHRDRLVVYSGTQLLLPSLSNLSAGQAILFNIFLTIIRYADQADLNKGFKLPEIEGIAIIDEIDAHLHADVQYEVVPELIALFPKVQFILTTHAPLVVLGLEKKLGIDGIELLEMPTGRKITSERFTEFRKSIEYYRATTSFEDTVQAELAKAAKPVVFTEGETDPVYIQAALEVLGHGDILNALEVRWIGKQTPQGPSNTGKDALNTLCKVLDAQPELVKSKVLLLYDCDANKQPVDHDRLSIRSIPRNPANAKITVGIENLLPEAILTQDFYPVKVLTTVRGEKKTIEEFDKTKLCRVVCQERRNAADFAGFSVVVDILKAFLDPAPAMGPDAKVMSEPTRT